MKKELRYRIEGDCTGCGACKVVCPKHCISKGKPYVIHEARCIKCGKCASRCWRQLIKCEIIEK